MRRKLRLHLNGLAAEERRIGAVVTLATGPYRVVAINKATKQVTLEKEKHDAVTS